jgi:hypothetical protein
VRPEGLGKFKISPQRINIIVFKMRFSLAAVSAGDGPMAQDIHITLLHIVACMAGLYIELWIDN